MAKHSTQAMTRRVRAAYEFYAVTQDGAHAGDTLDEFNAWLDDVRADAVREANTQKEGSSTP